MDPGQHWLVHLITTNIFQWNVIENAIVLIRVNAFKISSTEGGHSVQAPLYQICMSATWTPVRFGWIPVLMHTLHDIYTAESAKHWSLCCTTDGNNAKPHMMTSSNGLFMRGIHRWPVNSQHKASDAGAWMLSWIYAWTNDWTNNGDAGDLRRNRAYYDVIVMSYNFAGKPSMKWGRYCDNLCQTCTYTRPNYSSREV